MRPRRSASDALVRRAGLPTEAPKIGAERALELMRMDKKVLAGAVRLVLLERLGPGIVVSKYPQRRAGGDAERALRMSAASALADYAAHEEESRGRRHAEPAPPYRSEYQRDRDRIVHSTAFRRLVYKTQVFVNHEGDLYRTRLTHSLEVAQIARTIARALRLNEVLSEAICLAHDLGHTPFGHAGQDALNECMREFGGFEHNLQSLARGGRARGALRGVRRAQPDLRMPRGDPEALLLQQCREARASSASASSIGSSPDSRRSSPTSPTRSPTTITTSTTVSGRASSASMQLLARCRCSSSITPRCGSAIRALAGRRLVYEILRRMINRLVTDLIDTSAARLRRAGIESAAEVRARLRR